ncbi:GroES-like protein [Aspergillus steynii IBT 23096]|uniref:GroES-like protein n=1 Tax=Aspergillus steynii IBT 23096 TaxID=1392250 RepID=A0A2I2FZP4_9EURO|nr:GroES-like protein [Aspergillus steynii IBT 23096]PLB46105.1 GroES-like protein [Aspergillus steynii IBT 23096]
MSEPITFTVYRGSPTGKITPSTTSRHLQHNEIHITATHSGICGTDEHFLHAGCVLGHEGIGTVTALGPGVTNHQVGDRVGFAYIRSVCGTCDNCTRGLDQYCRVKRAYGTHDFDVGSFAHGTVWDASCVFPILEALDSADAAPLMCAGATVWSCLTQNGMRVNDRVGVLGIGGLGHLAIKLASALGYQVVALSGSEKKREEARGFGAEEFHALSGVKEGDVRPLKHLLVCGSGSEDYTKLIPLMDTTGTIYHMAVSFDTTPVPTLPLLSKGVRIQGSFITSRNNLQELLEFAARKKIRPMVVKYPFGVEGIENAMQDLRDGKVRYRAVLVPQEERNGYK